MKNNEQFMIEELESRFEMEAMVDSLADNIESTCTSTCSPK